MIGLQSKQRRMMPQLVPEEDVAGARCVPLPDGWDEDKTGNGPNERPRTFFVTSISSGKTEYVPEDLGKIRAHLSSYKHM